MSMKRLAAAVAVVLALTAASGCGPDGAGSGGSSSGGTGSGGTGSGGTGSGGAGTGGAGTTALGGDKVGAAHNPCTLLTPAELASVVATVDKLSAAPSVTQAAELGEFQGRVCRWSYPRQEVVTDTAEISVTAWHGLQYYTPNVLKGFTPVSGIGDAAHVSASMFMFRKGDEVFLVSVFGDANGDTLRPEIAKLLAGKV